MDNTVSLSQIEQNKKFNKISKWGYISVAVCDPYGLISIIFAFVLWNRSASKKQTYGFLFNAALSISMTYIFDTYFNNLTGTIVYSLIFATVIPAILYCYTLAPIIPSMGNTVFVKA